MKCGQKFPPATTALTASFRDCYTPVTSDRYAETYLPTEEAPPPPCPRLFEAATDARGTGSSDPPPPQGPAEAHADVLEGVGPLCSREPIGSADRQIFAVSTKAVVRWRVVLYSCATGRTPPGERESASSLAARFPRRLPSAIGCDEGSARRCAPLFGRCLNNSIWSSSLAVGPLPPRSQTWPTSAPASSVGSVNPLGSVTNHESTPAAHHLGNTFVSAHAFPGPRLVQEQPSLWLLPLFSVVF